MAVARVLAGSIVAALTLGGGAFAADTAPDLAFGAYQRGLYRTAFAEATKRAERDHADGAAMALLGELTAGGLGVAPNLKTAADWFELAAARGDRNAQYSLAMMYLAGRGVPKDKAHAKLLLQQAAKAGQPSATYNLGLMALDEKTADGDKRGAALIRQAAEAGVPEAEYALGLLMRSGKGVELDRAGGTRMLALAASDFYEPAEVDYAIALFNGDGTPKDEKAAARLFMLAAARGNPIAQNRLARLYVAGRGVPVDLVEAAAWNAVARNAGREDPWLDSAVEKLTPEQLKKVAGLVRKRLSAFQLGMMAP